MPEASISEISFYKKIQVSIIIINYNTFELTCQCIQSILDKTQLVSFEIILVDNASVECDPEMFKEKYPFIKLIKSDINLGFSKGNNLGIKASKGEVILLLNSDTLMINDAISICYNRIIYDTSIGVITCNISFQDGRFQWSGFRFPSIFNEFQKAFRIYKFYGSNWKKIVYLGIESNKSEFEADWLIGAFFMFRKNILEFFPENKLHDQFFMYEEYVYWSYFIKNNLNFKNIVLNKAKIIHYINGSKVNYGDQTFHNIVHKYRQQWMLKEKGTLYTVVYLVFVLIFDSTKRRYPYLKFNKEILKLITETIYN